MVGEDGGVARAPHGGEGGGGARRPQTDRGLATVRPLAAWKGTVCGQGVCAGWSVAYCGPCICST